MKTDEELKRELLALAETGAPRPAPDTELGAALERFTTPPDADSSRSSKTMIRMTVTITLDLEAPLLGGETEESVKRDLPLGHDCPIYLEQVPGLARHGEIRFDLLRANSDPDGPPTKVAEFYSEATFDTVEIDEESNEISFKEMGESYQGE